MRYLAPLLLSLPFLVTSTASVDSFHSFSTSTAEKPRGSPVVAYVNYAGGDFQITPEFTQTDCLAVGNYTDTTFLNGWTNLEVRTRNIPGKDGSPQDQAYAAGMVEGFLTAPIISNAWRNTMQNFCDEKDGRTKQVCSAINSFLLTNLAWMQRMISANPNDPYWHQMDLILNQLQGMADGYGRAREVYSEGKLMKLDEASFLWTQISGDLEDLVPALSKDPAMKKDPLKFSAALKGRGRCSALIKLLPDFSDLYVSQVTWNVYQAMLRILKKYDFSSIMNPEVAPGAVVAFSSYPGLLYSGDDFHLLSSGLVSQETTIGNNNPSLWPRIQPTGQLLEWARTILANRLARDGQDWTDIFSRFNSGTYNNQWMVVDYNKFYPGVKKLKDGLLWVLEQLPGHIERKDATEVLREQQYWPSYNTPYFKTIFKLGGSADMVKKYGDWFSYDRTPRALIFAREQRKVNGIKDMILLMRYNDYQNDPLSRCNCTPPYSAENAISARNDLNPKNGTYPFPALGHRSHGAIDVKVTSHALFKTLRFIAFAGPTYDNVPPFRWSEVDFAATTPHYGQPDLWQFGPILTEWYSPFD